jgi:hypothetical protein
MKFTTCFGRIAMPVLLLAIASPRIAKASPREDRPTVQHFFCNTGYAPDTCREQIAILKTVVAKYPTEALGEWTWVLVRSQDWKAQSRTLGLNPDSPAFTCLETRTTFIEEALVTKVPGRASELISRWRMGMTDLLNTAVEHEMGHALCHSLNEDKANHLAQILEQKRHLSCNAGL